VQADMRQAPAPWKPPARPKAEPAPDIDYII
jgi:hypothetical protein